MAHDQHVIKIQKITPAQPFLIALIQFFKDCLRAILGIIMIQIQHLAFHEADLAEHTRSKLVLILDVQFILIHQFPDKLIFLFIPHNIRCLKPVRIF